MSDRAKAGVIASFAGVLADLVMFGGDMIVAAGLVLITDPSIVLSFMGILSTYAERVAWLSATTVDQVYNLVILLALAFLAIRILERIYRRATE